MRTLSIYCPPLSLNESSQFLQIGWRDLKDCPHSRILEYFPQRAFYWGNHFFLGIRVFRILHRPIWFALEIKPWIIIKNIGSWVYFWDLVITKCRNNLITFSHGGEFHKSAPSWFTRRLVSNNLHLLYFSICLK